jgi:hypothetical protein
VLGPRHRDVAARGEDWFLQLDAHMDFDPGWDARLVAQARALGAPQRGLAISTYPAAFRLVDGRPRRETARPAACWRRC